MVAMSLARAWRRQLYGASSAALIVPSAMLAAVLVLALGGGFGQISVLGQIFAGPPAPSVGGGLASGGGAGTAAPSLPAIPVAAVGAGSPRPSTRHAGTGSGRGGAGVVPASSRGPTQTGGAVGGAAPIAGGGSQAPAPSGSGSGPSQPSPSSGRSPAPGPTPPPEPSPAPRPTPVDRIVGAITPVTEQVPAPAGPAVTQAVEAAGSAADSVLPPGVGSGAPPEGLKLP
jgi:hypothetical protein